MPFITPAVSVRPQIALDKSTYLVRTVHLEAEEGSRHILDRDDRNLRLLTPGWSHL